MRKSKKSVLVMGILVVLILTSVVAYAASSVQNVSSGEIIQDDAFMAGQTVRNDGTVKGDFFSAARKVTSVGTVEGDFLSAASDIYLEGKVLGDARCASGNIIVNGMVDKNLNVFAGTIDLKKNSQVGRNLLVGGGTVNVEGKVSGNSRIYGGKVTLNGEFLGNVEVYLDAEEGNSKSNLLIMPDTVIHGKLTYQGIQEATIKEGAKIQSIEWKETNARVQKKDSETALGYLGKFVRLILTTLVYFSIAAIGYKVFPNLFTRQGYYIGKRPLNTVGIGLVAMIAILASVIAFVVLMLLSIALISPAVGLIFGCVVALTYTLLFYFSTMPVSMWLGNLVLKGERHSTLMKFGTGLAIITIGFFILDLLSKIPLFGVIVSLVSFLAAFCFVVLGIGALLCVLRDILAAAQKENVVLE
ncbi:MAG: hypothetical protein N2484_00030 [Clostridia bacterium]|nr:hypothetical protein [Clostridia bacterium]